ncbi:DUF4811 domain-containing protein [Lacticaseibacillus absianus]|uniref:DUF4811 domain-containing protein n=1 Tax=Lacticaseibacillus absianus TaxID=2729623 RepID=UPI0015CC0B3B|nr:DUF4811 domain-containing protein [Lacticaseibacillus absianus]
MILVIMTLAAIAFFFVAVLGQPGPRRRTGMLVLGVVLIASAAGIAANDASRFGLVEVTTVREQPLVGTTTATTLTTRAIGTTGQRVAVVYRTNPLSHKVTQAVPSPTVTTKLVRGTTAKVTTTDHVLKYRNSFYALLFAWSGQNHYRLHRTVTFSVPNDWTIQ